MTAHTTSAAPPLHPSALAHGSERGPRVHGPASQAVSAPSVEQHADGTGAERRDEQHDPPDRSAAEPSARTSAMPAVSPAFRRATHAPQVALPGLIAFAAAIHCASVKRTPIGGRMPRSKAQTKRWCGV
jgi:hypothetical protein